MTPAEAIAYLNKLADEATPGPWRVEERYVMALKEKWVAELPCGGVFHAKVDSRNARLIALAPDLARLCAEAAELFVEMDEHKVMAAEWFAKLSELETP